MNNACLKGTEGFESLGILELCLGSKWLEMQVQGHTVVDQMGFCVTTYPPPIPM